MQMTRGLVEYGRYRGDEARAAKVLHGHCPDRPLATCAAALRAYAQAWRDGVAFVAAHVAEYDALRRSLPAPRTEALLALEVGFAEAHPTIPPPLLEGMLFAIHDWHHVR